jgi:hypothetical protein
MEGSGAHSEGRVGPTRRRELGLHGRKRSGPPGRFQPKCFCPLFLFLILFPALFLLLILNLEFEFKSCGEFVLKFVCFEHAIMGWVYFLVNLFCPS